MNEDSQPNKFRIPRHLRHRLYTGDPDPEIPTVLVDLRVLKSLNDRLSEILRNVRK